MPHTHPQTRLVVERDQLALPGCLKEPLNWWSEASRKKVLVLRREGRAGYPGWKNLLRPEMRGDTWRQKSRNGRYDLRGPPGFTGRAGCRLEPGGGRELSCALYLHVCTEGEAPSGPDVTHLARRCEMSLMVNRALLSPGGG